MTARFHPECSHTDAVTAQCSGGEASREGQDFTLSTAMRGRSWEEALRPLCPHPAAKQPGASANGDCSFPSWRPLSCPASPRWGRDRRGRRARCKLPETQCESRPKCEMSVWRAAAIWQCQMPVCMARRARRTSQEPGGKGVLVASKVDGGAGLQQERVTVRERVACCAHCTQARGAESGSQNNITAHFKFLLRAELCGPS